MTAKNSNYYKCFYIKISELKKKPFVTFNSLGGFSEL